MTKKKKLKLKKPFVVLFKLIFIVAVFFLGIYGFYLYQIKSVTKMGYSKEAAKNILLLGKKDYVKNIEANETLNKAILR